jgi:hypothetical protein
MTMNSRRITFAVCGLDHKYAKLLALDGAFARIPGVRCVYVNPVYAMAYVEYDPCAVTQVELVDAIEEVGLQVGRLAVI